MGKRLQRICISFLRKKILWTLIIFIVYAGFLDPNCFWNTYQLYQQNEALRHEIEAYKLRYENDTRDYEELKKNQEALERVARVNLYMKTANEDVYIVK